MMTKRYTAQPGEVVRDENGVVVGRICKDGTEDRRYTRDGKASIFNGAQRSKATQRKIKVVTESIPNEWVARCYTVVCDLFVVEPEAWAAQLDDAGVKQQDFVNLLITVSKDLERAAKLKVIKQQLELLLEKQPKPALSNKFVALFKAAHVAQAQAAKKLGIVAVYRGAELVWGS